MRKFQLGELAGHDRSRVAAIASVLDAAGIQTEVVPDVEIARWTKFVMVCATGGVMALTRLPAGPIFACPESRQLFPATMNEVVAIGLRLNVKLNSDLPTRFLDYVQYQMGPSTRSSQLEDVLADRRLELESLNGKVVRLGDDLGIDTPMNDAIYAALKPYVDGRPIADTA